MIRKTVILSMIAMSFVIFSCIDNKPKEEDNSQTEMLTELIAYDVDIKSKNPDFPDYLENIPYTPRKSFMEKILEAAENGKLKMFRDMEGKEPFSVEEYKQFNIGPDTTYVPKATNPTVDSMVIIQNEINIDDITAIRFVEEWKFDKDFKMKKKLKGYAPLLDVYFIETATQERIYKGQKALFWLVF